jgi:transposase-like protein
LSKLKRLAAKTDNVVEVETPISLAELMDREKNYPIMFPKEFAKKYRDLLFKPIKFHIEGDTYYIQFNRCINPFCKWFGETQKEYSKVKYKPHRYRLEGSKKYGSQNIRCYPDPTGSTIGTTWNCNCTPFSNWSVAEEISRLATMDRVKDVEKEYNFHREACSNKDLTPIDNPKDFYKRGKSTGNSQKWQCKACGKMTNVLPSRRQSTTYGQKRNDILPSLAAQLLNRTPVKRTCEILQIGSQTYYSKLEWLYRRCLEFNERYEIRGLKSLDFNSLWINTDKMIYYLNNVRRRGQGGERYDLVEEKEFPTHVVISADMDSRYVFRSDVAYDWFVATEDIVNDTATFKDDHIDDFSRKNARLRYSYYPQAPTKNDEQSTVEYMKELDDFNLRNKYVDGMHVNSTYTTMAHFFHLKILLNAKEWRFVSDNDSSIITALFRVFAREIKRNDAHHFLNLIDKDKSRRAAYSEFIEGRKELKDWVGLLDSDSKATTSKLALAKLVSELRNHNFYEMVEKDGHLYRKRANNPIVHPLPMPDQGFRTVDFTTDLSSYEIDEIARMILNVSDKATSAFIQQIRRRLSILERPLVTARGDQKSYIYANFNPKYAQMALTILRTFYNYCLPYKSWDKQELTPAQRIGLTDKVFTMRDIIYFR